MLWEIYTYGGGEYLNQVFKAVQLFFGGPFQTLAQLAGLLGIIVVLMAYLGPRQQLDVVYILRFAVFYGALFVPKADVSIVDRIEGGGPYIVDNVPLGIAALAGITSTIGDKLTTLYEGFISAPDDQKYHKNGMAFGATLLKSVPQVRFTDATMAGDMQEFISHCAFAALASGAITVEGLEKSPDVWALLRDSAPNNRFVMQSWSSGAVSCRDAATHPVHGLNARMPRQIEEAEKFVGKLIWNKMTPENARLRLMTTLPATANDLASIARTSSDIMRQAMTINAIAAALDKLPPDEAAGAMASIQAKTAAERSRFETYMTMGAVASRSVPIMRAVLEALAYALFPVVAVMILLPSGLMALTNYFIVLFWLQMWPVIYAVLNSIVYWYSVHANKAGAMMPSGLTDWTMWSTPGIVSTNSEIVAMAGYLALSVPMIAYMLVRGGAVIGSQVATALMQPAQGAATQAGREVAYGTLQSGTVTVDTVTAHNSTMWQHRTGYGSSYGVNIDGSSSYRLGHTTADGPFTTVTSSDGISAHRRMESEYGVTPKISKELAGAIRTEENKQWQAALEHSRQYSDLKTSTLMRALGIDWSKSISTEVARWSGYEKGTEIDHAAKRIQNLIQNWMRDTAVSDEDKARLFLGLNGSIPIAQAIVGFARSLFRAGKLGSASKSDMDEWERNLAKEIEKWKNASGSGTDKVHANNKPSFLKDLLALRAGAEGSVNATMAQVLKDALGYMEQNNLGTDISKFERAVSFALRHTSTSSDRTSGLNELRSLYGRTNEERELYEAKMQKSRQLSEAASKIESGGASYDVNITAAFDKFLMENYGIHDPARFAYESISRGDGRIESYVSEFVNQKADTIIRTIVGDAPVERDVDRERVIKEQHDADSAAARGSSHTPEAATVGNNRFVQEQQAAYRVPPRVVPRIPSNQQPPGQGQAVDGTPPSQVTRGGAGAGIRPGPKVPGSSTGAAPGQGQGQVQKQGRGEARHGQTGGTPPLGSLESLIGQVEQYAAREIYNIRESVGQGSNVRRDVSERTGEYDPNSSNVSGAASTAWKRLLGKGDGPPPQPPTYRQVPTKQVASNSQTANSPPPQQQQMPQYDAPPPPTGNLINDMWATMKYGFRRTFRGLTQNNPDNK